MAIITQKYRYFGEDLNDEVFGHMRWLRFAGFVLSLLGIATVVIPIVAPMMPALHPIAVLAGLLGVSGAIYFAHALAFWRNKWLGFTLHMLAGTVYLTVAYIIYLYPLADISILAVTLIISYLIVGVFRIFTAMAQGIANLGWGWTFLCGIVNIGLAFLIWTELSTIGVGLMGLIIGTELLFTGWALFMLGANARRKLKSYTA